MGNFFEEKELKGLIIVNISLKENLRGSFVKNVRVKVGKGTP